MSNMRMKFQVCQTAREFSMHLIASVKVKKPSDLHFNSHCTGKDRDKKQTLPALISTVWQN